MVTSRMCWRATSRRRRTWLLRQLIIIPVESQGQLQNWAWTYGLITAAVVAVGITYFLVRRVMPGEQGADSGS